MPQIEQLPFVFVSQLFWLAVVFGIIYFWIGRGMVPKIQSVVEDRDRKIADDLAAAQRAREQAEAAEEAYRQRLDASRSEAMTGFKLRSATRNGDSDVTVPQISPSERFTSVVASTHSPCGSRWRRRNSV